MPEINPETISMEELRKLADKVEDAAPVVEDPVVEAAEAEADKAEMVVTVDSPIGLPNKIIYRREIDNGDGSGAQVFQAESLEELADKLAEAQRNASKKIREQAAQLKQSEKPAERKFTDQDEFVYSQELQTKPTEAFKKLFKDTTGYNITDFKSKIERVDAFESAQRSKVAQDDFVNTHPYYECNASNAKRLAAWLQTNGYHEFTTEGLNKAYDDLTSSGLLTVKPEQAEPDTDVQAERQRIAEPTEAVQTQRVSQKKASGLNTRSRSVPPPVKAEPTLDELYSMPLDKLRELGQKAALANNE